MLSAEELLAGSSLTFTIEIPPEVLAPGGPAAAGPQTVRLKPLSVQDIQLVTRAAKENGTLIGALMVQRSLVEPELGVPQVLAMPAGLMQFLLRQVNRISGIEYQPEDLNTAMEAPLTKAAHVLAREYGWTPQEVAELTLGQILVHLKLLSKNR